MEEQESNKINKLNPDSESEDVTFNTIDQNELEWGDICNSPLERLGVQIRLRRKKAGYDICGFAAKTGVDLDTLAAIEYGYGSLEDVRSNLDIIAGGLGIKAKVLRGFLKYLLLNPLS